MSSITDNINARTQGIGSNGGVIGNVYERTAAVVKPYLPYMRAATTGLKVSRGGAVPYYQQNNIPAASGTETGSIWENINPGVQIGGVNENRMGNSNIEPTGGVATANAYGTSFRIPNAAIAQLMLTDSYNQGRSNEVGSYFGMNQKAPAGMGYANVDVAQQRLNEWWAKNPNQASNQIFNPVKNWEQTVTNTGNVIRQEQAQPMMEQRTAAGNIFGADVAQRQRNQMAQAQSLKPEGALFDPITTGGRMRAAEYAQNMQDKAIRETSKIISPTFSNLPIKESYLPKIFA
jgi:hypothetical protein